MVGKDEMCRSVFFVEIKRQRDWTNEKEREEGGGNNEREEELKRKRERETGEERTHEKGLYDKGNRVNVWKEGFYGERRRG